MDLIRLINECKGFDWDEGNILKNWEKNGVSASECEQIFFNFPLVASPDEKHSVRETRFYALGHTDARRYLLIVFTIRKDLIRVISARDTNRKERRIYETL
jgi:uncharacterized DUF497 family protein